MKVLLFLLLVLSTLFGDFFIVSGDKKVKMSSLETGKIDFSTFKTIAHINRGNDELHAQGEEVAFNHRHLNFRLSTIGLVQSNYTMTEYSDKAKDSSSSYYIDFHNFTRDDGVMLQLFYKNKWYVAVLGNPLKILQDMFLKIDIKSIDLDLNRAIEAIKQARRAFPLDDKLKMVEIELEHRRANEAYKPTKNSTPNDKPVKVLFN
ncbi:hypothetical protein [Sulfurimonas sp.]|uniref:hypothetical protein n=1 Tax=Sulfurimonas sp. TaxID=2022749 RepID=UPI0035681F58